jgi:hypothetical protein
LEHKAPDEPHGEEHGEISTLHKPQERPWKPRTPEDVRLLWVWLLIAYLTLWSGIVTLLVLRGVSHEIIAVLIAAFVTPIINLVAIVIGFYFGRQKRVNKDDRA